MLDKRQHRQGQIKRTAFKIWFHHVFLREEYNDQFDSQQDETVRSFDHLIYVPVCCGGGSLVVPAITDSAIVAATRPNASASIANSIKSSSSSSSSSNSKASNGSNRVYKVPTFRAKRQQRHGSNSISGIVNRLHNGSLTQQRLENEKAVDFRSKEFFDEPHGGGKEEHGDRGKESLALPPPPPPPPPTTTTTTTTTTPLANDSTIRFNENSYLFVYKLSPTEEAERKASSKKKQARSSPSCVKPILKAKTNCRELEEFHRATQCDHVDFESFMDFFEDFELKRFNEDDNDILYKFREQQLQNYYDIVNEVD